MPDMHVEMNFCRRCGSKLSQQDFAHVYRCEQGHTVFMNAAPAVGVVLFNHKGEIVLLERATDPGKGLLDIPGGFCDGAETAEAAIVRELEEEIGLSAQDYTTPEFLQSFIDPYVYKGETLSVISLVFTAHIKGEVLLTAADDAAKVMYELPEAIDLDQVYFVGIRAALELIRDQRAA